MSLLSFPELYCPFPSKVNKYADVLEDYAVDWLLGFNILVNESSLQRFCKSKFYYLAAATYPYCEFDILKITNDWNSWLFIWDDQCDMSDLGKQPELLKAFHQRFLEILNGAELTHQDIPLSYALADLRLRISQYGSKNLFIHFIHSVSRYFDGCVLQAYYRAKGVVPDIDTYIKIRNMCSAVDSCLALIELGHNIKFPNSLRKHHSFQKLNSMTNNIISWCNDLFSASREIESGDIHNLVYIIHYHEKITLDKAIMRTAEIHDKQVKNLIILEESFPSFEEELDTNIAKYISGCNEWIRGNYNWYFCSGRYKNQEKLEIAKGLQLIAS